MIFNLLQLIVPLSISAASTPLGIATTPDVAWLMKRIAGERLEVKTLAKSGENFHFIEARPDYVFSAIKAKIFCRVGAELEVGWAPKIIEKSANKLLRPGGSGDCDLSTAVNLLEVPTGTIDRSMGDAHAAGNPHFWLSPKEMSKAAAYLEGKLATLLPEYKDEFAKNLKVLTSEFSIMLEKNAGKLKSVGPRGFYQYHKDYSYFMAAYGLRNLGSIEEIPGVAPSAARLGAVSLEAKSKNAMLALASPSAPKSALAKFQEVSGVVTTTLPTSINDPSDPAAYEKLQTALVDTILQSIEK